MTADEFYEQLQKEMQAKANYSIPIHNENHITEEMIEDTESVLTLQPGHITS